jgi:type VI protein secretion system component Hcp
VAATRFALSGKRREFYTITFKNQRIIFIHSAVLENSQIPRAQFFVTLKETLTKPLPLVLK